MMQQLGTVCDNGVLCAKKQRIAMCNHGVLYAVQQQCIEFNNGVLLRYNNEYCVQQWNLCYNNGVSHRCNNGTLCATMYIAWPVEVTNWPKIACNHDLYLFAE